MNTQLYSGTEHFTTAVTNVDQLLKHMNNQVCSMNHDDGDDYAEIYDGNISGAAFQKCTSEHLNSKVLIHF